MIYVELPPDIAAVPQPLPFYLAMEEHLARAFQGEYFFMWQVQPTVIFGRNQVIDAEVNLPYCHTHGIATYRRKSGGGCVYADMNNIMFSHITTSHAVATTFAHYTSMVADMLCRLGIAARTTGRNDIMIGDRKVSGYAFYHINLRNTEQKSEAVSRAIVHGTMLYDADLPTMMQALTPSQVKLNAKGVNSVRKHVTTIREHSSVSLAKFKVFARSELCKEGTLMLTHADVVAIKQIAEPYFEDAWIYGKRHAKDEVRKMPVRIDGVGEFVIDLHTDGCSQPHITALDLKGDFFLTADLDSNLIEPLIGCAVEESALLATLQKIPLENIIPNLKKEQLAHLIMKERQPETK